MAKINPKNIPKTQADVDRAWKRGVDDGVHNAMALFFNVMLDKFDGGGIIVDIWKETIKLSDEVSEGRVKIPEIVRMLREEYGIEL